MVSYLKHCGTAGTAGLVTWLGLFNKSLAQKRRCISSLPNVICYGVPTVYKDCEVESVESYLRGHQLLEEAPKDRLIRVRPDQPFVVSECGNRFLWSAAFIPFMSHKRGQSTAGLFKSGSLCVIKPLGILGVKGCSSVFDVANLKDEHIRANFSELKEYLLYLLAEQHGKDVLNYLPKGLQMWLTSMIAKKIDEEQIAFDPTLLPKESKGHLAQDVFMHLRQAPRVTPEKSFLVSDILAEIYRDDKWGKEWSSKVIDNAFLHIWVTHSDAGERRLLNIIEKVREQGIERPGKLSQLFSQVHTEKGRFDLALSIGIAAVELHRHSSAHVYDASILQLVQELCEKGSKSLADPGCPYNHLDVLDLLEYEFPEYLSNTMKAIKSISAPLWREIDIKRRFPLTVDLGPDAFNDPQAVFDDS